MVFSLHRNCPSARTLRLGPDTLEARGWQGSPVTSEGSATSGQGLWLFCIGLLWILRKGTLLGGCNTVQRQKGWQMESWLYFIPPPPPQPLGSMSLCSKQPEPLYMVALNGKVLKAVPLALVVGLLPLGPAQQTGLPIVCHCFSQSY